MGSSLSTALAHLIATIANLMARSTAAWLGSTVCEMYCECYDVTGGKTLLGYIGKGLDCLENNPNPSKCQSLVGGKAEAGVTDGEIGGMNVTLSTANLTSSTNTSSVS